jgi:HAD superfamily hydrolase (TIGR01509 family)
MITTVVFDADETLVDLRPAVRGALVAVLDRLRVLHPTAELSLAELEADWAAVLAAMPAAPVTEIRRTGLARSLARIGCESEVDRLLAVYFEYRFALCRPFDDAVPTLAALRSRYRLGYATNGNSRADLCGLASSVDFEVYAHVSGLPKKPAPEFFAAVVDAAGVNPGEIIHIGDNFAHDVVGARTAGMRAIWLNPVGLPMPEGAVPDAQIRTLTELPAVIDQLSTGIDTGT